MKTLSLRMLLLSAFILLAASCKKDEPDTPAEEYITASGGQYCKETILQEHCESINWNKMPNYNSQGTTSIYYQNTNRFSQPYVQLCVENNVLDLGVMQVENEAISVYFTEKVKNFNAVIYIFLPAHNDPNADTIMRHKVIHS